MKIKAIIILGFLLCNTAHAQYTLTCKLNVNESSTRKFRLNQDQNKMEEIFDAHESIFFDKRIETRTEEYILVRNNKTQISFQSAGIFYFSQEEPYKNLITLDTNMGQMKISAIRLSTNKKENPKLPFQKKYQSTSSDMDYSCE